MSRLFRHALVFTVAFALVTSAAAWRQCTGLQLAAAAAASVEHGSHQAATSHGDHDHHAMQAQHAADDPAPPTADDHGCLKCCAMCTVANALPPGVAAVTAFTLSSRMLPPDQTNRSGGMVAVDPGIPKRIV